MEFVLREKPELIALQEVNQSENAPRADEASAAGMVPVPGCGVKLRSDNHALRLACWLRRAGVPCSWAWLPVKTSYGRFDEGLAMFSLHRRIECVETMQLSRTGDYRSWKRRSALGVKPEGLSDWFYTVHMGWWDDEEEPFLHQWQTLHRAVSGKERVWLMGDFNAPAGVRGEGYDRIRADGWLDAWLLAEETRGGATVRGKIDGWRDRSAHPDEGVRIDHIWTNRPARVRSAQVVFDGISEPQVSDHFGVLLETKGETV